IEMYSNSINHINLFNIEQLANFGGPRFFPSTLAKSSIVNNGSQSPTYQVEYNLKDNFLSSIRDRIHLF
ncbi:hypothetical protein BLOT_003334, partial [Blomia tropicalis]